MMYLLFFTKILIFLLRKKIIFLKFIYSFISKKLYLSIDYYNKFKYFILEK